MRQSVGLLGKSLKLAFNPKDVAPTLPNCCSNGLVAELGGRPSAQAKLFMSMEFVRKRAAASHNVACTSLEILGLANCGKSTLDKNPSQASCSPTTTSHTAGTRHNGRALHTV